ncbi:DUF6022 family protein [Alteribacter natronophilus]|uniref:DUF6022 family protein n=1 Tax=Alteribacter natronophilus TaxID=2583810 RepID=UPI00110EAF36|nr:DUF6022 family protein [Alteribacter natronophilus]TMW71417.1 hypothetical protein FGB90_10215 [Alteribacter natronophilus]
MQTPAFTADMTISQLGTALSSYVEEKWRIVLENDLEEFQAIFPEYEDATYGIFTERLLAEVWKDVEQAGFSTAAETKKNDFVIASFLHFSNSLEKDTWGPPGYEKRVFWIVVQNNKNEKIGTLLFELPHSHAEFSVPEAPRFLPLSTIEGREIRSEIRRRNSR